MTRTQQHDDNTKQRQTTCIHWLVEHFISKRAPLKGSFVISTEQLISYKATAGLNEAQRTAVADQLAIRRLVESTDRLTEPST